MLIYFFFVRIIYDLFIFIISIVFVPATILPISPVTPGFDEVDEANYGEEASKYIFFHHLNYINFN